jgi:hypothetical protein
LAQIIESDDAIRKDGHVTVVVEDKCDVDTAIRTALGMTGVGVVVAILGFRRVDGSPILQGNLEMQATCFEQPGLNRDDLSVLTAQGVAERIMSILHYRRAPFLANQIIVSGYGRDDRDDANVARVEFSANTLVGYEKRWMEEQEKQKGQ